VPLPWGLVRGRCPGAHFEALPALRPPSVRLAVRHSREDSPCARARAGGGPVCAAAALRRQLKVGGFLSQASGAPAARCATCAPATRRQRAWCRVWCAQFWEARTISGARARASASACAAGRRSASTRALRALRSLLMTVLGCVQPRAGDGRRVLRADGGSVLLATPERSSSCQARLALHDQEQTGCRARVLACRRRAPSRCCIGRFSWRFFASPRGQSCGLSRAAVAPQLRRGASKLRSWCCAAGVTPPRVAELPRHAAAVLRR
jgi:hypothetical protein